MSTFTLPRHPHSKPLKSFFNGRTGKHNLEIIGAGFSRAGTVSLKYALQILGHKYCWHILDTATSKYYQDKMMWWKGIDLKLKNNPDSVDFDEFFTSFKIPPTAALDWPIYFYLRELIEYYPNAKIILSIRPNKEAWHKSCVDSLNLFYKSSLAPFIVKISQYLKLFNDELIPKSGEEWGSVKTFMENPKYCFAVMDQKIKLLREEFDENKLLIFNVKDGWKPLCKFLNKPIPKQKFPHANDKDAMRKAIGGWLLKQLFKFLLKIGSFIIFITILYKYFIKNNLKTFN